MNHDITFHTYPTYHLLCISIHALVAISLLSCALPFVMKITLCCLLIGHLWYRQQHEPSLKRLRYRNGVLEAMCEACEWCVVTRVKGSFIGAYFCGVALSNGAKLPVTPLDLGCEEYCYLVQMLRLSPSTSSDMIEC